MGRQPLSQHDPPQRKAKRDGTKREDDLGHFALSKRVCEDSSKHKITLPFQSDTETKSDLTLQECKFLRNFVPREGIKRWRTLHPFEESMLQSRAGVKLNGAKQKMF